MVADRLAPWAEPAPISAETRARVPEDGWRYELVQGRLIREPHTGYEHGQITPRLLTALLQFVEAHALGVVCEVASPGQAPAQMGAKARLYLDLGVRVAWIIWPERREVDVWIADGSTPTTLDANGVLEGGDVLPGFELAIRELFD